MAQRNLSIGSSSMTNGYTKWNDASLSYSIFHSGYSTRSSNSHYVRYTVTDPLSLVERASRSPEYVHASSTTDKNRSRVGIWRNVNKFIVRRNRRRCKYRNQL